MNIFDAEYQNLNLSQKEAVDSIDGPVLVIAGPGTGKTQLLSLRVGNILRLTDTQESSILCLTFTDSGAKNIRARIKTVLGKKNINVNVFTFHGFATEVINQNQEYFFNGLDYRPIDDITCDSFINNIFDNLKPYDSLKTIGIDGNYFYFNDVKSRIKDLKEAGLSPDDFQDILISNKLCLERIKDKFVDIFDCNIKNVKVENVKDLLELLNQISNEINPNHQKSLYDNIHVYSNQMASDIEICLKNSSDNSFTDNPFKVFRDKYSKKVDGKLTLIDEINYQKYQSLSNIYREYQNKLQVFGYYDYQDMILRVLEAFDKYQDLRYKYQEKFLYIMVDEFQDTNGAQMKLVQSIIDTEITENNPNILVVGDDDQAIFKFQKASVEHINRFRSDFQTRIKIITLTDNYRSKQVILDFATDIISNSDNRLAHLEGVNKHIFSKVEYGD